VDQPVAVETEKQARGEKIYPYIFKNKSKEGHL
jgi:hypothetical protein